MNIIEKENPYLNFRHQKGVGKSRNEGPDKNSRTCKFWEFVIPFVTSKSDPKISEEILEDWPAGHQDHGADHDDVLMIFRPIEDLLKKDVH
jgi:hypothetical protein